MTHQAESFDDLLALERRTAPDRGWGPLYDEPVRPEPDGRWIIAGHEEMRQIFADPRVSSGGTAGRSATLMDATDPPEHEWLRRHFMRSFGPPWHPRRVDDLEPIITDVTSRTLSAQTGPGGTRMDVVDDFAYPIPVAAICALLGLPAEDHRRFAEWMKPFNDARDIAETQAGLEQAKNAMTPYLAEVLAQRRAQPRDDMISGIATDLNDSRAPGDDQIVENLFLLFLGGHETTINAVSSTILLLLRHPDVLDRVRADISLVPATFEEALRLEPPAQVFGNRHALADITVGEHIIPAGARLVLVNAAANRDPRRFTDPHTFDIDRRDNEHLSFQGGAHYCFGAPLARLEARIMLTQWLLRVENPRLAGEPPFRPNSAIRGPLHLPVDYDRIGETPIPAQTSTA